MNYVWKLGAYSLAGVAAFAVALAVILSASSTPTADAQIQNARTGVGTANSAPAANGDTVLVADEDAPADSVVEFKILPSSTADASFTHSAATNNGQDIICQIDTSCDVELDTDSDGALDALTGIQVAMKIADDSPGGFVIITSRMLTGTNTTTVTTNVVTVTVAQVPAKIEVTSVAKAISASDTTTGTLLNIRLTDTNGKGVAGKRLTIVSNRALLVAMADGTDDTRTIGPETGGDDLDFGDNPFSSTTGVLAGTVVTSADADSGGTADNIDSAGYARVRVTGAGAASPGLSTITVTLGTVTGSADITLYGPVTTITAEAEESAIELGGKTRIVVTATDRGGNPVAGVRADVKVGATGVVGPPGSTASTEVTVDNDVDKDVDGTRNDIPACGDDNTDTDGTEGDPVVERFPTDGTNDKGQCVIEVEAQDPNPGTANDAMRGTHTITVNALSAVGTLPNTKVDAVPVEIAVGGPPSVITSDAPARIDPSDELNVNLEVVDDEGVLVGSVYVAVVKTDGPGAIIADAAAKTKDGRASFTYLASSRPDVVEFLVRTYDKDPEMAGAKVTAKLPIVIQIGEAEPEEPPTPPVSVSGQSGLVVVQNADSIEDILGALVCGDTTGTTVTLPGNNIYAVGAPAVVNARFLANIAFPIELAPAYVSCGG